MTTLLQKITAHETEGSVSDLVYPVSNTYDFSEKKEVVFINTGDVHEGKFLHNDYSPVAKLPGQAKKIIERGDILFSEIRPKNRHFALVDFDSQDYVVSTKLIVLKVKEGVDPKFAYTVLTADKNLREFQNIAESRSGTFPQITFDSIADFTVKLPDFTDQEKIAQILGAYDAKIDNNNAIIKNLETMAQLIFSNIADNAVEGRLIDEAEVVMGQSPASSNYNENGDGLPFHQGVTYFGERFPQNVVYSTGGEKKARPGDILVSVRAPVGRINIASSDMVIGRGLSALRSKSGHQSYLFYLLKNLFHKEDLFGSGSVFPAITKKEFENLSVDILSNQTKDKFERQVAPLDQMIKERIEENVILKQTKDRLLAKLI